MSVSGTQYKIDLEGIAGVMRVYANGDAASLQITSDGTCILRKGVQDSEHLRPDQAGERLADIMDAHLEAGGV